MRRWITTSVVAFALISPAVPSTFGQVRKPQPAPATARLDYRAAQALKDAAYYLNQIEPNAEMLAKEADAMKVGDATVNIGKVQGLLDLHAKMTQYMTNANNRFQNLPATHPDVAKELARVAPLTESLNASSKKLQAVHDGLKGVVAMGAGPQFKTDIDRMSEINQMFNDLQIIQRLPSRAIEIIKQIEPAKAERKRIADTYAGLMNQPTAEAKRMRETLAYYDQVGPAFEKMVAEYVATAPGEIDKDCEKAVKMATDAAAEKRHLWFKEDGGIAQQVGFAQTKYQVLEAAAPTGATTASAKAKITATQDAIKAQRATLLDAIVAANQAPADAYGGADKAQLIEIVKAKWVEGGSKAEVLRVGINSGQWDRDTRWEWSSGSKAFYKIDVSRAQGHVVVKISDTHAAVYYINLTKDHLKQDKISAYYFDDPKGEPEVTRKVPLANLK